MGVVWFAFWSFYKVLLWGPDPRCVELEAGVETFFFSWFGLVKNFSHLYSDCLIKSCLNQEFEDSALMWSRLVLDWILALLATTRAFYSVSTFVCQSMLTFSAEILYYSYHLSSPGCYDRTKLRYYLSAMPTVLPQISINAEVEGLP